jgi:hypothetical protein
VSLCCSDKHTVSFLFLASSLFCENLEETRNKVTYIAVASNSRFELAWNGSYNRTMGSPEPALNVDISETSIDQTERFDGRQRRTEDSEHFKCASSSRSSDQGVIWLQVNEFSILLI